MKQREAKTQLIEEANNMKRGDRGRIYELKLLAGASRKRTGKTGGVGSARRCACWIVRQHQQADGRLLPLIRDIGQRQTDRWSVEVALKEYGRKKGQEYFNS